MRSVWRVSRPIYAAAAASAQAVTLSSSAAVVIGAAARQSLGTSRLVGATAIRWQSTTATTTPVAAAVGNTAATEATASQAAAAATKAAEDTDAPSAEPKDVGAETTKVLTIADVLSHREAELSKQGTASPYFDQWESISGSHTIQDAIDMMVESNIGSLIVTEENAGVIGIVTERDVMKKTSPRALGTDTEKPVKDIMSAQIMCIPSTTTVIDALATMTKENIRHLAVINGGEINNAVKKGSVPEEAMRCVLSIKDIVKAYSDYEAEKKQTLEQQQVPTTEGDAAVVTSADTTVATPSPAAEAGATAEAAPSTPATDSSAPPVVTAATLLKKKNRKIKLILNTRVEDNITAAEAVEEMAKHNFGAVLIVDKDQRVEGIFTERDYLTKVLYPKEDPTRMRVVDLATKRVTCLQIEDTLEKCWTQAATLNFRHFPVIGTLRKDREKELAGILSIKDIVREISKGHETPSGFRLFEFFKSKMAKDDTPAPPPPATPAPAAAATETAAASTEPEKAASTQETPEKQELAAKIVATESAAKKTE